MRESRLATWIPGVPNRNPLPAKVKGMFGLVLAALVLAWWPAQAQERDDQYVEIFTLIQQADTLYTSGKTSAALPKYQQAQTALLNFRKSYPDWNVKTVAFRLGYLDDKIASCSGKGSPATGSAATQPATASGAVQVKLLEAGAEPRKALRLHPKPGDKQTLAITLKMAMDMKIGEMQSQSMKLPAMNMTMELTIKSVSAEGDVTYEMVMGEASVAEDPNVTPQMVESMKASLSGLKGLSGTGTMSSRGVNEGMEIKVPTGADAQLSQAMGQMKEAFSTISAPFPEEAVGPGARWEVKMPIKSQGMTINQTATYEIVSSEGERLIVKNTMTQSASNQKIQSPAMPQVKVDVTKMTGNGTGDLTLDLARLLPAEATIEAHSDLAMGVDTGGQKQTMAMKTDLNLHLETK